MCRWLAYLGEPIWMSEFLTEPSHSLIRQSYEARFCSTPLSGDGFGVAWYPAGRAEPGRLRLPEPAWNNRNLLDVAQATQSHLILAHVRSATVGFGVAERDCHPFVSGHLAFMHNGNVPRFAAIRRELLSGLSDDSFAAVEGITDSEHVFGVFLDEYRRQSGEGVEALVSAVRSTILRVLRLVAESGTEEPTVLNLAVADGQSIVCSRVHRGEGSGGSLFYCGGGRYSSRDGVCVVERGADVPPSALVASEPLSREGPWAEVPDDCLAVLQGREPIRFVPFEEGASVPRGALESQHAEPRAQTSQYQEA